MNEGLKAITERAAKVIDAYVAEHGDQVVMSRAEIMSLLDKNGVQTNDWWLVSDHCYNHYNKGLKDFETDIHLFEYVAPGKYRLLGSHSRYNGKIIWHTKRNGKTVHVVVGMVTDGVPKLWDESKYYETV